MSLEQLRAHALQQSQLLEEKEKTTQVLAEEKSSTTQEESDKGKCGGHGGAGKTSKRFADKPLTGGPSTKQAANTALGGSAPRTSTSQQQQLSVDSDEDEEGEYSTDYNEHALAANPNDNRSGNLRSSPKDLDELF